MNVLYLLDCDINGYRYASEFRQVPTDIFSFMCSKTNEWTKNIMTVIKISSLLNKRRDILKNGNRLEIQPGQV